MEKTLIDRPQLQVQQKSAVDTDRQKLLTYQDRPALTTEQAAPRLEDLRARVKGLLTYEGQARPRKIEVTVINTNAIVEQISHREAEEKLNVFLQDKNVNFLKRALARIGNHKYKEFYREARGQVVERFANDPQYRAEINEILRAYEEELVYEEEKGEKVVGDSNVNAEVSALFVRFAQGDLADQIAFDREVKQRVLPLLKNKKFVQQKARNTETGDDLAAAYESNLYKQAVAYREVIRQTIQEAIDKYGEKDAAAIKQYVQRTIAIDVQLGKKERSLVNRYPEGKLGKLDKMIEGVQNMPVLGKLVSPALLGAVSSIFVNMGMRRVVGIGAAVVAAKVGAPFLAAMATGGVFGGLRRGAELKRDRGLEMRRAALGTAAGGERARRMREFDYEMINAQAAIERLRSVDKEKMSPADRAYLADVFAALEVERRHGVDLIVVDSDQERALHSRLKSLNDLKQELKRLGSSAEIDPAFQHEVAEFVKAHLQEVQTKDVEFARFRRKEILKATVMSSVFGLAGGFIAQKLGDAVYHGIAEGATGAWKHLTEWFHGSSITGSPPPLREMALGAGTLKLPAGTMLLQDGNGRAVVADTFGRPITRGFSIVAGGKVPNGVFEDLQKNGFIVSEHITHVDGQDFSQSLHTESLAVGGSKLIELPDNLSVHSAPDGSFQIIDTNGKEVVGGLQFGADGKLTAGSRALLQEHGWGVREQINFEQQAMNKRELIGYLEKNHGLARGHRLDWHGNGTPLRHVNGRWVGADGKELQLKIFGGAGDKTISVKDMLQGMIDNGERNWDGTVDGAYHHLNWAVANRNLAGVAENFKIRVFIDELYPNGKSFEIPLNANGEISLDKNSELYGVLFDSSGKLKATIETVLDKPDGSGYHTLATVRAHGNGSGTIAQMKSVLQLDHPPKPVDVVNTVVQGPPTTNEESFGYIVTPWYGRKPMERVKRRAVADEHGNDRSLEPPRQLTNQEISPARLVGPDERRALPDETQSARQMVGRPEAAHSLDYEKVRQKLLLNPEINVSPVEVTEDNIIERLQKELATGVIKVHAKFFAAEAMQRAAGQGGGVQPINILRSLLAQGFYPKKKPLTFELNPDFLRDWPRERWQERRRLFLAQMMRLPELRGRVVKVKIAGQRDEPDNQVFAFRS